MSEQQLPSPTDIKKFLEYIKELKTHSVFEGSDDGELWTYPIHLTEILKNECRFKYYRIINDRHWILRQKWIESGFKLKVEMKGWGGFWEIATPPYWYQDSYFREKPMQEHIAQPEEICEKHRKFAEYWKSLGKPPLECKMEHITDTGFSKIPEGEEPIVFLRYLDYRLTGDRHWKLRKKWVDSDFKLPIEFLNIKGRWSSTNPKWRPGRKYREKPASEPEWIETEVDQFNRLHKGNNKTGIFNADGVSIQWVSAIVQTEDTGAHYRFVHRAPVTEEDSEQGYVDVKLDPFRIAAIYNLSDFALQTILKKTLCAGNRGHNDLREDLKDIICAAKRKLEMLDEDEQLTKTAENKEEA